MVSRTLLFMLYKKNCLKYNKNKYVNEKIKIIKNAQGKEEEKKKNKVKKL